MQRYSESELISNRSAVLLCGGSASERRAWAEDAAGHFEGEGELVWVKQLSELLPALSRRGGVVGVEDVAIFDHAAQGQILNCLMRQEERPKLVLGLKIPADAARANGQLRDDLHYRLSVAQVDLTSDEVKAAMRERAPLRLAREKALKAAAAPAKPKALVSKPGAKPKLPNVIVVAKPKAAAARKPAPAKAQGKPKASAKTKVAAKAQASSGRSGRR